MTAAAGTTRQVGVAEGVTLHVLTRGLEGPEIPVFDHKHDEIVPTEYPYGE